MTGQLEITIFMMEKSLQTRGFKYKVRKRRKARWKRTSNQMRN